MSNDPIAAAIAAAQAAQAAQVPAVVSAPATAPALAPRKMSLDDLTNGSLGVDGFVKVAIDGITLPENPKPVESFVAIINLKDVQVVQAIRFGKNPAQYDKSSDGVTAYSGGSWTDARARAFRADPQATEYPSADIPMILKDPVGTLEAGHRVGYSTPPTGRDYFVRFLNDVTEKGLNDVPVVVEVGYEKRQKNSNKWANLTFKLLGAANAS